VEREQEVRRGEWEDDNILGISSIAYVFAKIECSVIGWGV
jgi:hypothetical protein